MYTNREGVIILLEDSAGRIALQLRDDKPGVVGCNCWGLFGGLMEKHETPEQAAVREIEEELGYMLDSSKLSFLRLHYTKEGLKSHIFHYTVGDGLYGAVLAEGQALEFVTLDLLGKKVVPHHIEIMEWYWQQRGEELHSGQSGA